MARLLSAVMASMRSSPLPRNTSRGSFAPIPSRSGRLSIRGSRGSTFTGTFCEVPPVWARAPSQRGVDRLIDGRIPSFQTISDHVVRHHGLKPATDIRFTTFAAPPEVRPVETWPSAHMAFKARDFTGY